ncbi:heavy metal translocating P-type ATPase [Dongia sp.]|uniref:heavy metal translocating P-type ATPase n=1 Tax=Dongia sp. TaxID=1977262 RepID=UPI0035AD9B90
MAQHAKSTTPLTRMRFEVEGMDCPSCAGKIERVLGRLPGLANVQVNYAASKLTLDADNPDEQVEVITGKLSGLGFPGKLVKNGQPDVPTAPKAAHAHGDGHDHDHDHADGHAHDHGKSRGEAKKDESGHTHDLGDAKHWWQSKKGKIVLAELGLLCVAGLIGRVFPEYTSAAFITASVIGLLPFARQAFKLAISGLPFSIETLMVVAAVGALFIGEAVEAAVVIFLFSVGELLESVAATKARAGIKSLGTLMPTTALLLKDGKQTEVPAASLAPGDTILVRPGDRVPADGEVSNGTSAFNDAAITGESMPVQKTTGDQVFAGSINGASPVSIKVTSQASDNTIARIIRLVEEAQGSKAPMARFIDDFSKYYTPLAMLASALVIIIPPFAFGADWDTWIYRGLSLLLIACPCALVLSTPAAIASGLARGARLGLLLKGGAALETLGKLKTIAFDKTGTLTIGHPVVTDVIEIGGIRERILGVAAAIEAGSSHPIGKAIIDKATAENVTVPRADGGAALPGKGVAAVVDGAEAIVGSPRYCKDIGILSYGDLREASILEEEGKTVVAVSHDNKVLGLIAVRDEPRPDAKISISELKALGVETVMLTGDNPRTAKAIASDLGLAVQADLLPNQKLEAIGKLKEAGPVAMIGDGINDAPALATASVGIAMGGGTGVAIETADGALLKDRVGGVVEMVRLSRLTLANVRQNVTIALGLKAVFLVTSLMGATPLWMAILADTGATIIVTANALRLLSAKVE